MISGYPIWVVLLIGCGVFCASFVDAIGGGGGIISVPVYLLAGLPTHFALGTNKLSSGLGTAASTFRYLKNGFVDWILAIPSVGFALVFRVRGKLLIFAFLGGLLSWGTYCIAGLFVNHEALQYLIATTALTLYAEAFARILKCPSTILLVTGWIPLIPGGALYYSISALVQNNMSLFVDRILHTFLLMIAMSAGMLIAMTVVHLITPLRPRHKLETKV